MTSRLADPEALLAAEQMPAEAAEQFQLQRMGARGSLPQYLRQVVERRSFLWELSKARVIAASTENRLGLLWELLNPLMMVGVYYLAFGLILGARSDVDSNFLLFLSVGVFAWSFISGTVSGASDSLVRQKGLLRTVHFPRVILPLAVLGRQLVSMAPKLAVLGVLALVTGEGLRWSWLVLLPAVLLAGLFSGGIGLIAARVVHGSRDVSNVVPFLLRAWMYLSGVFYSIETRLAGRAGWLEAIGENNPGHLYLTLFRGAFMPHQHPPTAGLWLAAAGWAVGACLIGIVVFWQAEERYGRD